MSTQPTNNPVPSESPRDLKFNAGKIDEFVTSLAQQYIDRFGQGHYTIEGLRKLAQEAISAFGYIPMDSFQDGATLTLPNQVLRDKSTGEYYRWDGDFPKVVASGSNPASSGGVGVGAWISVGDAALRSSLASKEGYSLIGELQSVADFYGMTGFTGKKVSLKSWYAGSTSGEGAFYFDTSIAKSNHDGGVYISPTVPYTTTENFIKGAGETDAAGLGCWVRVVSMPWIHADWYGLNSTVDAGVVMNAVSKRAAFMRLEVRVRKGTYLIKTAWNHTWVEGGTGRYPTPNIYGDGAEFTTFVTDYASFGDNAYGVIFTGSKHLGQDNFKFYGIGFRTNSPSDVAGQLYRGFCVKFTDFWGLDIDDLRVAQAYLGVSFDNVLYFKFSNWRIAGCHIGSRFRRTADLVGTGNGTGLNAGVMENCRWSEIAHQAVLATESHGVKLVACSFENNGNRVDYTNTKIVGDACTRLSQSGAAGGVGWVFDTCYFESNGISDIAITRSSSPNLIYSVIGCIFNKTTSHPPAAARIRFTNGRASGDLNGVAILIVKGCSFNDYAVGSTYKDIEVTGFSLTLDGYGHVKLYEYENNLSGGVIVESGVSYLKAGNELANVRVGTTGVLTNTNSAKTCTKTATGVYDIRFATSVADAQVQINLKSPGFATYSQTNNQLVVTTVNSSGAAQDISFDLTVTG